MSEDFKNTQKKETGDFPAPSPDQLWNQLSNAVALVAKQDQIVWAVFGVFWAANAVLLVALFTTGKLPEQSVGIIVSGVGLALSVVWLAIDIGHPKLFMGCERGGGKARAADRE
jgi:hypothetical protein